MIEFKPITDQTANTGPLRHWSDGLIVALVVIGLTASLWALLAMSPQPEAQAAPLRIHTDCSGFVEGGE
jgi:hypothetical protein